MKDVVDEHCSLVVFGAGRERELVRLMSQGSFIAEAVRLLDAASMEADRWPDALRAIAAASGGGAAQLVGGGSSGVVVNVGVNLSPVVFKEFEERSAGDPKVNPRMAAVHRGRLLVSLAEADFISPEERARHALYQEFFRPNDAAFRAGLVHTEPYPELTR